MGWSMLQLIISFFFDFSIIPGQLYFHHLFEFITFYFIGKSAKEIDVIFGNSYVTLSGILAQLIPLIASFFISSQMVILLSLFLGFFIIGRVVGKKNELEG